VTNLKGAYMSEDIRSDIVHVAIDLFNKYGTKFTMDDVAKSLHISKKTIYKHFGDKTEMLMSCIDYCFSLVKEAEDEIVRDKSLDVVEKLKRMIIVMPDGLGGIDWIKVSETVNTNPELYRHYREGLDKDWNDTMMLYQEAIDEGKLKPVPFNVLKIMIESSMDGFIRNLKKTDVGYTEALKEMMDILMSGLIINK